MRFPQSKLDELLKKWFYHLGVFIGHHPGYFIIVPALLTALFATGFQQLVWNYDPEYLLSPSTGAAKDERKLQESYFPVDYQNFQATRMSRIGKFGRLIVTQKDLGSILRTEFWNDLIDIEEAVYNISIEHEGVAYRYEDICARWNGYCKYNEILGLAELMPEVESGSFNLSSPLTFDPVTFQSYILPAFFGGIVTDDIGRVRSVEAVSLTYFLDLSEKWQFLVGEQWEKKFVSTMAELALTKPKLSIVRYVSSTQALEMEASKNTITPNLVINIMAMVLFCVLASSMADSVKSKPLIGFLGILSASLATISGFGLICYAKVDFISLCLAAPFLLFGIGIDDTFVMLSSWRRCERYHDIPERLGHTFSDAAVSITVTSLTDFLSFMAGVITPFPCVRIFCLYTGTAVAFIYLWQLTFFGGCLAIAGFAEQQNRHGLICVKVQPRSLSTNRGWFYRLFCAGGKNPVDLYNPKDNGEHAGMVWLRDNLGYALGLKWVKSLVLMVFTAYIVVSIWGITRLKEGLEKRNTVNYDSYSVAYYDAEDKYYLDYRYVINVVVSGDIYYSDPSSQDKLEKMMKEFENSTFIASDMSTSWLRDFLGFVERNKQYEDYKIDTESDFVNTLDTIYLSDPSSPLTLDVSFNQQRDRIIAARFILQGFDVKNANEETEMLLKLRQIAEKYSVGDFKVSVFHPYFIYIDQFLEILPQTIQSILVTSGFMMVVSFVLIPNPICSLWVAFSILSIEAGVVGYMTWWGINLDGIALINLIMCIGFSVDFSAHICYHYMSEENKSPDERIRSSLYALGLPIIQGALSTILGVLGLAFAPCYAYVTFFKMIFLVIFLGAMHGLILLPVLLSLFGPGSCSSGSSKSRDDDEMVTCNKLTPTLSMAPVTVYGTREDKCCVVRRITQQSNSPMQKHRVSDIAGIENIGYDGRNNDSKPYINNKMINPTDPRLTPVPETDEAYDSIMHVLHVARAQKPLNAAYRSQQRLVRTDAQRPCDAHAHRFDRAIVDSQRMERGEEKMAAPCALPNRVVTVVNGDTRPQDKLPDINHKRLIRSVSHRPDIDLKNKFDAPQKQPLRKYHSFPYKVFVNDTGYSSDDSI